MDISRIRFPYLKILVLPNNSVETLEHLCRMHVPYLQVLDFSTHIVNRKQPYKKYTIFGKNEVSIAFGHKWE